jgi:chitosanase
MDVDCDGSGRCGDSPDQKSETRWPDLMQSYTDIAGSHVDDLNANNVPCVVFGNGGNAPGYTTFDSTAQGIQPLSVMAVVCGDQMVCLPLLINMAVLTGSRSTVSGVTPMVSMLPTCL